MMKTLRRLIDSLALGLIGLALLLTGCAAPVSADLMAGVQAAEKPANPDPPAQEFLSAAAKFSWNLLRESAVNPGNVLVSPASVYLALAMTLNGADTSTREAMLDALAARGLSVDELNAACRDWQTLLTASDEKTRLTIANSIWYRQGFNADPAFLQKNADYFAAGARMLDFTQDEAVQIINGWVSQNTQGTIEKILEKISPQAVMYLINTIYFKADWKTPFIKNYTADQSFAAPDGPVAVPFMHRTDNLAYLEQDGLTGILLPYADEQYAFFAILPPSGQTARQMAESAAPTLLSDLLQSSRMASVELSMPLFETDYEDSLVDEMTALGMGKAFQPGDADFSLMSSERSKDLYISEIKHKTFCKINETGTEAAAATLVEISKTGLPSADILLAFDRPFLYGIIDQLTGLPVFLGIMENPAE
ncbi:MAG TPA: serine proteinase inhibitor [Clostridiales bacterium]|nr:serine proteinase inhibitor [Clostridiales bacterium]